MSSLEVALSSEIEHRKRSEAQANEHRQRLEAQVHTLEDMVKEQRRRHRQKKSQSPEVKAGSSSLDCYVTSVDETYGLTVERIPTPADDPTADTQVMCFQCRHCQNVVPVTECASRCQYHSVSLTLSLCVFHDLTPPLDH